MTKTCSVDGCDKPVRRYDKLCRMHAERLRKTGKLDKPTRKPVPRRTECAIDGCNKLPYRNAKMCSMHTARWHRTGTTDLTSRTPKSIEDLYEVNKDTNCFEFKRHRDKNGYGRVTIAGKKVLAHRAMYEKRVEKIPEGLHLCHKCDNPCCVNPDHMFIGTQRDNMKDMVEKGRSTNSAGEDNPAAKLKTKDVLFIRKAAKENRFKPVDFMEMFMVSKSAINSAISGRTWKNI